MPATEFRGARQKPSRCCLQSCWQSCHGYPPPSELHRFLIRTGLAARVAHVIGVGGMAAATDGINVEPVIQGGDDSRAITIDVDIARSRSPPGEVHRLASAYFVAARSEDDLPGCRRRRCW
jgi:hypothetical protein